MEPYHKLSYKSDADSECLESSKLVAFAATATKIKAIKLQSQTKFMFKPICSLYFVDRLCTGYMDKILSSWHF